MTHELPITTAKWTKESVVTFWEYIGQREDLHWEYFTQQVGVGLTEFLAHTGRLKPRAAVLDYGCGPGFLIQHLLDRGVECYGADSSIKSVFGKCLQRVARRLSMSRIIQIRTIASL